MTILFQYRNIRHLLGMYVTKQAEQEIYLIARWSSFLFCCCLIFSPCVVVLLSLCVSQENLLRLVNIEYSVRGLWDLLQPGRV